MYKTGSLLLVSVLVVGLMAPPAPSQSRKITLEDVTRDLLDLQHTVMEMQRSADAKNADMKTALDQILSRFSAIDTSVQKLGVSLSAIKTDDENSARELKEARAAVNALKDSIDKADLAQTLQDLKSQMVGVNKQLRDMQNTEAPLPTARQAYDSAFGLLSQGFYDDAIGEFRDFLNTYPRDPRASRAQLELGNAYFNQNKFPQAELEYDLAIQNYPESGTKCTALYKKGKTLEELKQAPKAKEVFQTVVKECPDTAEGSQATAELKGPLAKVK